MILLGFGVLMLATVFIVHARTPARYRYVLLAASAVAFAVTIAGWRIAPRVELYNPPWWGWYGAFALTLAGFICISIYIFRGTWRTRLRSPLDLAVVVWSVGHLLANGDAAGVILFGGLAAASLLRLFLMKPSTAAPVTRQGHDALSVLIGTAMFGAMAQLHQVYAGVPVFVIPALAR